MIFDRLIDWWGADKHHLRNDKRGGSYDPVHEEFRARFEHLVEIMTYVVAPRLPSTATSDIKIKLARLLRELDEYKIPSLRVWMASLHIFPDRKSEVYENIADEISSTDSSKLDDAVSAVTVRVLSSPIDQCDLDPETDYLLRFSEPAD